MNPTGALMDELLSLLEKEDYSRDDAVLLVKTYPELAANSDAKAAAAAILAKRAERFCETEPEKCLRIISPQSAENTTTYQRRMAEAYFSILTAVDWTSADSVIGLREGLNKFLSNVYLKAVLRGTKKHHCTHMISLDALALVKAGKGENLVFEHVVPKDAYIQKPCEARAVEGVLTVEFIEDLLKSYWRIASVTSEEAGRLHARRMPEGWDGIEVLARYHAAGIDLVPNPFFTLESNSPVGTAP
jgi:hypothetical protein